MSAAVYVLSHRFELSPLIFCRYPGGLKERSAELQFEKDPTEILRKAVYGMLPKNKLRNVSTLQLHCVGVHLSCFCLSPCYYFTC